MENPLNPRQRQDKLWVCVNVRKNKIDLVEYSTLKWTRKESISAMTISSKSGRPYAYNWKQFRKWGWRCVKVNLSFEV